MYNLTEAIVIGANLLKPFMPETSDAILAQLNASERDYDSLDKFGLYESGKSVTASPKILFSRKDIKEILTEVEKIREAQRLEYEREQAKLSGEVIEEEPKEEVIDAELMPLISYDDFAKLQLQVGKIVACEEVPKSKKLLKNTVQIGSRTVTILSGIKSAYSPAEMVGKKVTVLVNLEPKPIAGILSEGMLLCAEDADGNLSLLVPEKDFPAGACIS